MIKPTRAPTGTLLMNDVTIAALVADPSSLNLRLIAQDCEQIA